MPLDESVQVVLGIERFEVEAQESLIVLLRLALAHQHVNRLHLEPQNGVDPHRQRQRGKIGKACLRDLDRYCEALRVQYVKMHKR